MISLQFLVTALVVVAAPLLAWGVDPIAKRSVPAAAIGAARIALMLLPALLVAVMAALHVAQPDDSEDEGPDYSDFYSLRSDDSEQQYLH